MLTLTSKQMRVVEKLTNERGISFKQMMENAGVMAFKYLNSRFNIIDRKCVILAGNGNNAGDGFVLARMLAQSKAKVTIIFCMGVPTTELSKENLLLLKDYDVTVINIETQTEQAVNSISQAHLLIDAMFGIGFHGELEGFAAKAATFFNHAKGTKIALDIPSGIDADTGRSGEVSIFADITLSFAAYKPAHKELISKTNCGYIEVLDIGIPEDIILTVMNNLTKVTKEYVASKLMKRNPNSHKGTYGKLINISGSINMCGASMMSTLAAMRTGAGIVTLATPRNVANRVAAYMMEAMTLPLPETIEGSISVNSCKNIEKVLSQATGCLIGCGLSVTDDTKQIVEYIIENTRCNIVLDADALNCIADNTKLLQKAVMTPIITPHIGEMARLVGLSNEQVADHAVSIARLFAKENNTIVVLKGHETIIASPTGEIFQNTTGNAGLAKGGSGDVLAGMIASLVTQGFSPINAAICGVYLHGACADSLAEKMSEYSMLARDIIDEIPIVLKTFGV